MVQYIGFDVAESGLRSLLKSTVEGLEDPILEVWARVGLHRCLALITSDGVVADTQNIEFHARVTSATCGSICNGISEVAIVIANEASRGTRNQRAGLRRRAMIGVRIVFKYGAQTY